MNNQTKCVVVGIDLQLTMQLDNEYVIPHLVSLCLPLPTCIDIWRVCEQCFYNYVWKIIQQN